MSTVKDEVCLHEQQQQQHQDGKQLSSKLQNCIYCFEKKNKRIILSPTEHTQCCRHHLMLNTQCKNIKNKEEAEGALRHEKLYCNTLIN